MSRLGRMVAVSLVALPVWAQTTWRWTDPSGTVHYSDDPSTAPKGARVESTEGDPLGAISAQRLELDAGAPLPGDGGSSVKRSDFERWWRLSFQRAHQKIERLSEEVAAEQRVVDQPTLMTADDDCAPLVDGVPWPYARAPRWDEVVPMVDMPYCSSALMYAYDSTRARLEMSTRALAGAKAELAELERQAANAAVPFEWRR